jgi:hypothetical protein
MIASYTVSNCRSLLTEAGRGGTTEYISLQEMKQGQCICPLSWSVHCNFTGDGKCNKRGWACTPPPSPAQPNFTLMTECTPESRRYYSVYSDKGTKIIREKYVYCVGYVVFVLPILRVVVFCRDTIRLCLVHPLCLSSRDGLSTPTHSPPYGRQLVTHSPMLINIVTS